MERKKINGFDHVRYHTQQYEEHEMIKRSEAFYKLMNERRSVRSFSSKEVPKEIIDNLIKTAGTAPSGAHKQPWTFCAVRNISLKSRIREAAEREEYESYHGRMTDRWLHDLAPIGTGWKKPFLETAPWLIVVFKKVYEESEGEKANNYYVNESVGIAAGILITAIHQAGLVTLTHTPSPMNFLSTILERPKNERPYLLLPVGYAAEDVYVPDLQRKDLNSISAYYN